MREMVALQRLGARGRKKTKGGTVKS
jgi:hypothetical protein